MFRNLIALIDDKVKVWKVSSFLFFCDVLDFCFYVPLRQNFSPKMLQVFSKNVHHIFYCWGVFRNVPPLCYAQMKEFVFEFRVLLWPVPASGNVQSWIETRILWNA